MQNTDGFRALLTFRAVLARPDFEPGQWVPVEGKFPRVVYCPDVSDFFQRIHQSGFPYLDRPYNQWAIAEAAEHLDHPERLQTADLATLRRVVAVHLRAERFHPGHLLRWFTTGFAAAWLDRLEQLIVPVEQEKEGNQCG